MITITKNKIYRSPFSLKYMKADSEAITEIKASEVIYSMGDEVEFGEDITFKELFDIIIFNKEFLNILFSIEMGGFIIDDFISDYEKKSEVINDREEFKLKISWNSDIYEYDDDVEFVEYVSFQAFGKLNAPEDLEDYPISLAFISLSEIKDKLVFIDNSFEIQDFDDTHNVESIFKANYKPLSLSDIIGGILGEISFYGKPEVRDEQRKELERRALEIDKWIEEGSIEENTRDWEEIREEFEKIETNTEDFVSFWDTLYPNEKNKKEVSSESRKLSKDAIDGAIIALSDGAGLTLEEQLDEALDRKDYKVADKIQKLIDKRDGKKM